MRTVLRVVIKEGFSLELANLLLNDIHCALDYFKHQPNFIATKEGEGRGGFHH